MTPEDRDALIHVMENACEMPTVHSRPLIDLQMAISKTLGPTWYGDMDDDDPLMMLVQAAIEVSESWSFYPPEQYGSWWALIDAGTVEALSDALEKYREATK